MLKLCVVKLKPQWSNAY